MSREPDHKQFNTETAQKTRKPPKAGPIQRRADEPHRIPLNVGLQATDKMKLLRVIARDDRLTDAQVRAAIPLVDLVHSEKGHSFFSWDHLGEQSGLGWQTAKRATDRFKELGYVNVDHIQGGVVHVSLNLDKINSPEPGRSRTLSRDEARAKAATKKASEMGEEMSSQTSPIQRQEVPEATPSQRQLAPVGMYGQTSPGMYGETSPAMYGQTSGEMYGETSKSENLLGEVIQREGIRDVNNDAAGASPVRAPVASRLGEDEVAVDLYAEKPAGKVRPHGVPRAELQDAYDRLLEVWPGSSDPIKDHRDHKPALGRLLMRGWTLDQILTCARGYADTYGNFPEVKIHLMTMFRRDFGLQGPKPVDIPRPTAPSRPWDAGLNHDDEDEREERRQDKQARRQARRFPSEAAEQGAPF